MTAKWGIDYDFHTDKIYKAPCCPECNVPIGESEGGKYFCFSCGKAVNVEDKDMQDWFDVRSKTKVELKDCYKCGEKKCMEITYVKNPVTLQWTQAYGRCRSCNTSFIV